MTYVRNPSGDLVYNQNTGSYSLAGYNVISMERTAFLKRGYLDPKLTTIDMNDVPFANNTAYGAFSSSGNTNLTTVTNINDNTVNMSHTFHNCHKLIGIDKFPNSVTSIESCFYNCRSLTCIPNIPDSVVIITDAFRNCVNLTNVPDMSNSVVYATGAYRDMTSLTTPPVLSNNLNPTHGLTLTFYGSGITSLPTIPNSITGLSFTFANCKSLFNCYSMSLPDSVTNMSYTFANCTHMVNSPILPNSVVDLENTFSDCVSLINPPIIPNSVTSMVNTFYNCTNMINTPVIPNTVVNMARSFLNCKSLTNMPTIPSDVTDMGMCFYGCENLTNVKAISYNITNMTDCFANCLNLITAPVIPRMVNHIEGIVNNRGLFSDCRNLTGNIYITSNSVSKAMYTFYNTSLPKNVYIPFKYANDQYTTTYNAFTSAGYDEYGTKEGVTLCDIEDKKMFTIKADVDDAIIEIENETNEFSGKGSMSIIVNKNTDVSYIVYKEGLKFEEGTITVSDDTVVDTSIVDEEKLFHITYDDENYTVITNDTTYLRVSNSTLESPNIANDFTITEEE